jgi:hypothetical protein
VIETVEVIVIGTEDMVGMIESDTERGITEIEIGKGRDMEIDPAEEVEVGV